LGLARHAVRPSRKATVAYGADSLRVDEPDTIAGTAPDTEDATVISGPPSVTGQEGKRTTFSHATGEARIGFHWSQLRQSPRRVIAGGAALAVPVALWVVVHLLSTGRSHVAGQSAPIMRVSAGHAASASRTPFISPLTVAPPDFVGPPLPPPEDLARAQAAAAARAQRTKVDPLGRLANPFLDPWEDEREPSPAPRKTVAPPRAEPAAPAPAEPPPRPAPARPVRQLIREL
jgi:hypothetical protein